MRLKREWSDVPDGYNKEMHSLYYYGDYVYFNERTGNAWPCTATENGDFSLSINSWEATGNVRVKDKKLLAIYCTPESAPGATFYHGKVYKVDNVVIGSNTGESYADCIGSMYTALINPAHLRYGSNQGQWIKVYSNVQTN
jgi:hypothetical protein